MSAGRRCDAAASACAPRPARGPTSARRRRQCAAGECRCACESIRRSSRRGRASASLVRRCAPAGTEPVPAMRLCMGAQRARRVVRAAASGGISEIRWAIFSSTPCSTSAAARFSALANAKRVGAAVALDDDALQPDERRAVVAARIDPALERHQHRIDDRRGMRVRRLRVNSVFRNSYSMCASPPRSSASTLPTKPSQTTTSVVPLDRCRRPRRCRRS